ncbi:hypothetical protein OIU79_014963 [Salix purpurea]|uniref:Uncharacterized protein n=1 Tax=Salix purpurea TaxID=77065 RepID=A0A9Q0SNY4_SALPP|nr:hypothetical protein OIU79_014963 [Salix purpurea]
MNKKRVKKVEGSTMPKGSVAAEQNVKKRERKVCDFSGQKRDPPEERDPLRIFYETLFEQIPDSEMAQFWLLLATKDLLITNDAFPDPLCTFNEGTMILQTLKL